MVNPGEISDAEERAGIARARRSYILNRMVRGGLGALGPTFDSCKANREPYSTLFCISDTYLDTFFMGLGPSARLFLLHFIKSELEVGRYHPRNDHTGSRSSMRVSERGSGAPFSCMDNMQGSRQDLGPQPCAIFKPGPLNAH